MRKLLFLALFVLSKPLFSQGIELYGGYPITFKSARESQSVSNWNNGQVGINLMIYTKPVAIQIGGGWVSNNYTVKENGMVGKVIHSYAFVPIMIHPKLYADGKNTLSVGAGVNLKFPSKSQQSIIYADGSHPQSYKGFYRFAASPRVAVRYSRMLPKSFMVFTEMNAEVNVMYNFDDGGSSGHGPGPAPAVMPYYEHRATLSINLGISYILNIDNKGLPKYFQKRKTKQ